MGWFVIRPVNAVLGWFFRGFNRGFDAADRGLWLDVGKLLHVTVRRAAGLRRACSS